MMVIGWIDNGTTTGDFTSSVAKLAAYEVAQQNLYTILRVRSGPQMPEGRNQLVTNFLKTDTEWLFSVDTDMVFNYDTAERLITTAEDMDVGLVGGLCYGVNSEIGQFPTIYHNIDGLPVVYKDVPTGIMEVDATGAACTVTHRSVFENYRRPGPHTWFHRREVPANDIHPGGMLGEDISWCWWLRENGVKILVDCDLEIGHIKPVIVNSDTMP